MTRRCRGIARKCGGMKRWREKKEGFTLVEMVVTFALISLFVGCAALVMSTFMRSHAEVDMVGKQQNVATTILAAVSGDLGAARYKDKQVFSGTTPFPAGGAFDVEQDPPLKEGTTADPDKKDGQLCIQTDGDDNSKVWYVSEKGVRVCLSLKDGILVWTYYPEKSGADAADPPDPANPDYDVPVKWQLGENVYSGCKITSFKVSQIGEGTTSVAGEPPACLEVAITLKSPLLKNPYEMKRSFECRNLKRKDIVTVS